jgi:hypothetical protein
MAYLAPFSLWRASHASRGALCFLLLASNLAAAGVEPGSTGTLIGPRLSVSEAAAAAIFEPA